MIDFTSLIQASPVVLGMTEQTPMAVLGKLIDACVAEGRIPADSRDAAFESVWQREQSAPTALTNGIAFPHGYVDNLPDLVVSIGVHGEGLEFGAVDHVPTRIFVLLLIPKQGAAGHVRFFAQLSQRLLVESVREHLLVAKTREAAIEALCPPVAASATVGEVAVPKVM